MLHNYRYNNIISTKSCFMYTVTVKPLPHPDTCNCTGPIVAAVVVPIIMFIAIITIIVIIVAVAYNKSKHA